MRRRTLSLIVVVVVALVAVAAVAIGATMTHHSRPATPSTGRRSTHQRMHSTALHHHPAMRHRPKHHTTLATAPVPARSTSRAPSSTGTTPGIIPQNNGGDADSDNNGSPSDGDGNI